MVGELDTKKLHPLLTAPVSYIPSIDETSAHQLVSGVPEESDVLVKLSHRHIVSARQFDRKTIVQLARLAASYESSPVLFHRPLQGMILISAFYEPSTRTRLSFESAWHRLGGDIMSITDAGTTGIAKGESLEDVAEMFNNYGDVVVLRDTKEQSVYRMLESLRIPIINAGNGIDEHPTQALADLYAILKWKPELAHGGLSEEKKIVIGIVGTPAKMRTVRSLMLLLGLFSDVIREVVVINPDRESVNEEQMEELAEAGLSLRFEEKLNPVLPELDVVYINSIAWIGDSFEKLTGDMKLTANSPLKDNAIILHPLARAEELDPSLDVTPHNRYFSQARGAVYIRMALLTCVVRRVNLVADVSDVEIV